LKQYIDIFPDIIKNERLSRGLTQAKMAELLDITVRHYQDLEHGRKKPGCVILYKLAHKVGVMPEKILALPNSSGEAQYNEVCYLLKLCTADQLSIILKFLPALLSLSQDKDVQ